MPLLSWSDLTGMDAIGLLAGLLTVATFAQRAIVPMRCTAICANVCFLTYASLGHFMPILTLHVLLIPVNILRLAQAIAARRARPHRTVSQENAMLPCGLFSIF